MKEEGEDEDLSYEYVNDDEDIEDLEDFEYEEDWEEVKVGYASVEDLPNVGADGRVIRYRARTMDDVLTPGYYRLMVRNGWSYSPWRHFWIDAAAERHVIRRATPSAAIQKTTRPKLRRSFRRIGR